MVHSYLEAGRSAMGQVLHRSALSSLGSTPRQRPNVGPVRQPFRKCCTWTLSPPERRIPIRPPAHNFIGEIHAIRDRSKICQAPPTQKSFTTNNFPLADPLPSTLYNRKREEKARHKSRAFHLTLNLIRVRIYNLYFEYFRT